MRMPRDESAGDSRDNNSNAGGRQRKQRRHDHSRKCDDYTRRCEDGLHRALPVKIVIELISNFIQPSRVWNVKKYVFISIKDNQNWFQELFASCLSQPFRSRTTMRIILTLAAQFLSPNVG